jgi:hypothetical protein
VASVRSTLSTLAGTVVRIAGEATSSMLLP